MGSQGLNCDYLWAAFLFLRGFACFCSIFVGELASEIGPRTGYLPKSLVLSLRFPRALCRDRFAACARVVGVVSLAYLESHIYAVLLATSKKKL